MSDAHAVRHHAHHFASAEAEFEATKQGMWVFLVTEVLMLGAIFVAFAIFRGMYLEQFKEAHNELSVRLGTTNTLVLITSSVTMLLAVTSAQRGRRDRSIIFMILTLLFACAFLFIKYIEWSTDFHHGVFPGGLFHNPPNHPYALFFSFYFVMTGIHGLHVLIGMGLISWILKRTIKGEFGPNYYTPVELVGFYWHFVDLVWIFLFPLLYLVG